MSMLTLLICLALMHSVYLTAQPQEDDDVGHISIYEGPLPGRVIPQDDKGLIGRLKYQKEKKKNEHTTDSKNDRNSPKRPNSDAGQK